MAELLGLTADNMSTGAMLNCVPLGGNSMGSEGSLGYIENAIVVQKLNGALNGPARNETVVKRG